MVICYREERGLRSKKNENVELDNGGAIWCYGQTATQLGNHTREGEKGARAVQSGLGVLMFHGHSSSHVGSRFCLRELPFEDKNAHGIPFEGIPLSPSHAGGEQKGSRVA